MKYILCLLLFIQSAQATEISKRWKSLLKLIDEEEKTINMAKKKSATLKYRLFELKTERIKLWQKIDNEKFMDLSTKGIKISRQKAFRKTRALYKETMNYGMSLIRRHPRSKIVPSVYYTLALNSRDFGQDNKEYRFLKKAIKKSSRHSSINYFARTSLAEYYYNKKKYKKAVRLYKLIVKNKQDEWLTKNLYNYGWCLLKTHKFDQAINTLEQAYKLSSEGQYINFQDQIVVGLTSFYVLGKQITRGRNFILKTVEDKYTALDKFLKKVADKGYYQESKELITLLPDYFSEKPKKQSVQIADLKLFEFDFYKQFNKKDKMFEIAQVINNIKLSPGQKESAIIKISNEVGTQQQILKQSYDKYNKSYEVNQRDRVLSYFDILSHIDKKNYSKYEYFKAETLYSIQEYKKALDLYKIALESYLKKGGDKDIKKDAMEGIFSCINFSQFKKVEELNELEYAYQKHIEIWPRSKKSKKIFPKLFALYLNRKDFNQTQKTLNMYVKSFKSQKKEQKDLFKTQLDLIIKEDKADLLSDKIVLLNTGFLNFSTSMIKKTEKILANMLFKRYQKLNETGKPEQALAGYKKVFFTRKYPDSIKADAGFNMGIIYVDLVQTKKAIKWFEKSLPLFRSQEKHKRRKYLDKVALRASLLQDLLNAAQLKKLVLNQFCDEKSKQNFETLQQAIRFDLSNNYVAKALHTYNTYKKCTQNSLTSIQEQLVEHLYLYQNENNLLDFIDSEKLSQKFSKKIGSYYETLFWKYKGNNRGKADQYLYRIKKLGCKSCKIFTQAKAQFLKFQSKIKFFKSHPIKISDTFRPNSFNSKLNKRISSLSPLLKESEKVFKLGHAEFSVLAYEEMITLIEYSADEIRQLNPKIKAKETLKQFKEQMHIVAQNIEKQTQQIQKSADQLIQDNQLYTELQRKTHYAHEVLEFSDIRNPASTMASTLDLQE